VSEPLAHRIAGEGPPIVLLNGGMMSWSAWGSIATRLAERYTVLSCDLRGQLRSSGPPPADLAGHARDVAALLDHVGWPSAHLVGVSYGGLVAVELAAASPEHALSLAVITAMDRETPELAAGRVEMREHIAAILRGESKDPFFTRLVADIYAPEYSSREAESLATRRQQIEALPSSWFAGLDGLLAALEGFDLRPGMARVRCPALVVIAREDRVMAGERARALAAGLDAVVVEHPTAGHGLIAEDPDWVTQVLFEFLDRQPSPADARRGVAALPGRR
jgi:pimeloyl-ACP methyl ester carboxylesterase